MRWLLQPVPAMAIIIITLLMFQLQNIPKMIITLLTAPLGIIGVTPALLLTGRPMGFVVQLGILALAGIIIRNSVILIDQIDRHIDAGEPLWDAIINATVSRFRPIMLGTHGCCYCRWALCRYHFDPHRLACYVWSLV